MSYKTHLVGGCGAGGEKSPQTTDVEQVTCKHCLGLPWKTFELREIVSMSRRDIERLRALSIHSQALVEWAAAEREHKWNREWKQCQADDRMLAKRFGQSTATNHVYLPMESGFDTTHWYPVRDGYEVAADLGRFHLRRMEGGREQFFHGKDFHGVFIPFDNIDEIETVIAGVEEAERQAEITMKAAREKFRTRNVAKKNDTAVKRRVQQAVAVIEEKPVPEVPTEKIRQIHEELELELDRRELRRKLVEQDA